MELSVREWTIIVGVLLILAVFLDGYRRVRNERSNRIRVSLSRQVFQHHPEPEQEPVSTTNPELPNGGARVIAKQRSQNLHLRETVPVLIEPVRIPEVPKQPREKPAREAAAAVVPAADHIVAATVDAVCPPAADSFSSSSIDAIPSSGLDSTAGDAFSGEAGDESFAAEAGDIESAEPAFDEQHSLLEPVVAAEPVRRKAAQRIEPKLSEARQWVGEKLNGARSNGAAKQAKQRAVEQSYLDEMVSDRDEHDQPDPQEVLVVNVLSKDKGGFSGPDLLQILLACDLRFGKRQIFHRFEHAHGRGPIQFSLANLVEPGTFDLDAIDTLTTPGVSFFMTLPGPQQSITAFNYMIETAQVLVRNLNAELRDDAHSVMTAQTIEHCRQRIRDFERRQLTLQL